MNPYLTLADTRLSFTPADTRLVLALAAALGKCPTHGRWFRNLTERSIVIESVDDVRDVMEISECSIQKVEVEVPAIIPTKRIMYRVCIPQYIPSSNHWEPDDVDTVVVGEFNSLAEAFSEFYMLEAQTYLRDTVSAVQWEMDQEVTQTEEV